MNRRFVIFVGLCAALWHPAPPAQSREADEIEDDSVWTAIIPDAFPRYIYTWHLKADGTYREDGRDASTDAPIQATLSGHWSREGARMILRQDDLPFVFDGVVLDNLYGGTLYLRGRAMSRFCAARGEQAPPRCDPGAGTAMAKTRSPSLNPVASERDTWRPF
jgi:hypothetical protein